MVPDFLTNVGFWVAVFAAVIAILSYVAPKTETKFDDKLLGFLKETVEPLINQKADQVKAEVTKQVTSGMQKQPPPPPPAEPAAG